MSVSILNKYPTNEQIKVMSKRRQKKHRVGKYKEIGFKFELLLKEPDEFILDKLCDKAEEMNLFLTAGYDGKLKVSWATLENGNYINSITNEQIEEYIKFLSELDNIEDITNLGVIDLWYC